MTTDPFGGLVRRDTRLRRTLGRRAAETEFRRAMARLNAMSDRELADLGLHRGDIRTVARHGRTL